MGIRWSLLLVVLPLWGCPAEEVVLHRSNCLVCHQPLDEEGVARGIEEAHPWLEISCEGCHGGQPFVCDGTAGENSAGDPTCDGTWVYSMEAAHVGPGDGPSYLKNLTSTALDAVDPDYLQFVNPGDLRVVDRTCGECHAESVHAVRRSTMAHTSGEITVARYRGGKQPHPHGIYGGAAVEDPNPDPDNACGVASLELYDPEPFDPDTSAGGVPDVAEAQEQYMVKSCMRCHLNDFGENRFPGDFRSSGCSACHMQYSNNGLSESADPWISELTVPHPITHQMVAAPPVEQCTHCHYRGGRIGISYQGYRESAGAGLNPDKPSVLGVALHGHDANYYLVEEAAESGWDETPPDLHFEAGMHCVDCHTTKDIHGDGHIYADTQCAVSTRCEDCHGTIRVRAQPHEERPHVYKKDDGQLYLRTKITDVELRIPQTIDSVTPGSDDYNPLAELAMGEHDGFSHTDEMECYTCHAGWLPSCYGCHVDLDMTQSKAYQTTGVEEAGRPTGRRRWVTLFDMVLMRNSEGKMAPSMPAERFFMTVVDWLDGDPASGEKAPVYTTKPRTFVRPDGSKMAGFGQRAFNPHTTRRRSQFMACDRCHTSGDPLAPDNEVLLDITHGFGSERFLQEGCDVTNDIETCAEEDDRTIYPLDAIQTKDGVPLVVVGHPDPQESRPLTLEEIDAMRAVPVPASPPYSTSIPEDAITNPTWPGPVRLE